MALKLLCLLLLSVVVCKGDDPVSTHQYDVHVYHKRHQDGNHLSDDNDKIAVHVFNPHARNYHTHEVQNYVVRIHEETLDETPAKQPEEKQEEKHDEVEEEKTEETDEQRKRFYMWQSKLYHYFVEDHEEKYDYAECDMVADKEHSADGAEISGRVVFKQNRNGGPLFYQVELHGFKPEHPDHGFHVHTYGDIINGCTHVGGHYHPLTLEDDTPDDTSKLGDMGDLHANEKGEIMKEYMSKRLSLHGPHSILGRAIVVDSHVDAAKDDENRHMGCCVVALSPGEYWHPKWKHANEED